MIRYHESELKRSSAEKHQLQTSQPALYTDTEKAEVAKDADTARSAFTQSLDKKDPTCGEKKGIQWWHNHPPANWPSTKLAKFGDCAIEGVANCARKVSLGPFSPISPSESYRARCQ